MVFNSNGNNRLNMKKITLLLLLTLSVLGLQAQTYQLNYDSIRVGKTAGTGGTSLYGKVYLKNVGLGVVGDSILTVLNGRIRKVPYTQITGLQDSLTKKANRTFDNVASGAIAKSKVDTTATGLQTVSNFFPKGDTRYQRSSVAPTSISATSPIFYNSGTGVISSQAASATVEGYVTTGTQTFAGNKTFNGSITGTSSVWSDLMQISRGDANSLLVSNTSATHAPIISSNTGTGNLHGFFNISGGVSYINNSGLLEKVGGTDAQFLRANGTVLGSTGSGDVVRAISPTLVTPNIGAATGTSVGLTGNSFMEGGLSLGVNAYQNYTTLVLGGNTTSGSAQYGLITDAAMNGVANHAIYANAKIRSSATATNAYGVYVSNPEMGAGATLTNAYGIYIANQTSGSTSNYSIYSAGGANYLAGGLTLPTIKITSGASNGYVLKSDASGNASWQSPTSSYKGTWNASTNTPTIADGSGTAGDYYYVTTGGTQFGRTFTTGGQAVYNGSIWEPVGVAASVTSVNGYTGAVTLAKGDVGLSNVDNTSDATKNAATATLTNKTISGSSNTLSNIPQSAVTNLTTDLSNLMPKSGGAFTGGVTGTTLGLSGSLTNSNSLPFVLSSPTSIDFHQSGGGTVRFVNDAFSSVNMALNNSGDMDVRGALSVTGAISGSNLSGTNTGDQTTITGNAGTATALQTARTISGTSFDGTADITLNNTGITNGAGYITASALSTYAPLASPALTGNPTAPTQSAGDNSTKIATTAYVDATATVGSGASKQSAVIFTDVNSSSAGAIDLAQHLISTATNGDKISFEYAGRFAANANTKPQMILKVDGTDFTIPSITPGNNEDWIISGSIIRVSSTIYKISINYFQSGQNNYPQVTSGATLDTNSLVITLTAPTTVANNDIVLSTASIQKFNAP